MSSLDQRKAEIDIRLHKKQSVALESFATEILYGGAVGGGKSFLMRVAAVMWCGRIPGLQVYLFRRLRDDLVKNHIEGPKGLRMMLAPWVGAGLVTMVGDEIRFWNGSKIYLCHCKDEKDRFKYLGAEIHLLLIDELTTFSDVIYRFLRSRLRMVGVKIPDDLKGRFPRIICGSNPGNVGHQWVKAAFIDPRAPLECEIMPEVEGGMLRQYIPARLEDNPSMAEDDPGYANKVSGMGNPELVRAMRDGDWNVVAGAFFPEFSADRHIIMPRSLPDHWARFRSFDWGSARPFAVHWWAVSDGSVPDIARGCLVCYREWYGMKLNEPNVGLRMTAEQVGEGIKARERDDPKPASGMMVGVADPAIFSEDGGPSIASRMTQAARIVFRPADNKRVPQRGAMGGWDQVRARLVGDGDGNPMVVFFSTCRDLIRTLPAMQHDDARPEDIDCWVAGTMVATPDGDRPIETIVAGDVVDTPIGPRHVLRSYLSGAAETVRVTLSDGRVLEGTPRHKIMIRGVGLVSLSDMECHMIPQGRIIWSRSLNIVVSFINAMREGFITIRTASISARALLQACIDKSGLIPATQFQTVGMSTTSMEITTTTTYPTSFVWMAPSIRGCTSQNVEKPSTSKFESSRPHPRGGVSAVPPLLRCKPTRRSVHVRADIVAALLRRDTLQRLFVPTPVRKLCQTLSARFAVLRSAANRTARSECGHVRIAAVGRSVERTLVYNLTVADAHLFYANGVLSSNTDSEDHAADSFRYAMMSRPYVRDMERQKPRDSWDAAFNRDDNEVRDWRVA